MRQNNDKSSKTRDSLPTLKISGGAKNREHWEENEDD